MPIISWMLRITLITLCLQTTLRFWLQVRYGMNISIGMTCLCFVTRTLQLNPLLAFFLHSVTWGLRICENKYLKTRRVHLFVCQKLLLNILVRLLHDKLIYFSITKLLDYFILKYVNNLQSFRINTWTIEEQMKLIQRTTHRDNTLQSSNMTLFLIVLSPATL